MSPPDDSPRSPRFSIIVPTRNRLASLRRAIAAIDNLRFDRGDREVFVVDDGSTDGTAACLAEEAAAGRLVFLRQELSGAAAARNRGIENATGGILAFTDDDCVVPPDWLEKLDGLFRSTGADAIGGGVENAIPSILSETHQDMASHFSSVQNRSASAPRFLTTNNFACRREALAAAGAFDTRFVVGGEDRELVARLLAAGFNVSYAPDVRVRHYHEFTLGSFARHYYRMGRGSYLLHRVIPRDPARRPATTVRIADYAGLVRETFRTSPPGRAVVKTALFALGQAAVLAAFLASWAMDPGRRAAPRNEGAGVENR